MFFPLCLQYVVLGSYPLALFSFSYGQQHDYFHKGTIHLLGIEDETYCMYITNRQHVVPTDFLNVKKYVPRRVFLNFGHLVMSTKDSQSWGNLSWKIRSICKKKSWQVVTGSSAHNPVWSNSWQHLLTTGWLPTLRGTPSSHSQVRLRHVERPVGGWKPLISEHDRGGRDLHHYHQMLFVSTMELLSVIKPQKVVTRRNCSERM